MFALVSSASVVFSRRKAAPRTSGGLGNRGVREASFGGWECRKTRPHLLLYKLGENSNTMIVCIICN